MISLWTGLDEDQPPDDAHDWGEWRPHRLYYDPSESELVLTKLRYAINLDPGDGWPFQERIEATFAGDSD